MDIKTAFLNAPLRTLQESSRKKVLALEDAHGRLQEDEGGQGGGHDSQEEVIPEEQQEEDLTKRKRLVLMLPPKILIRLGLVKDGEMWLVERALYGLRESPKLWGDYRDIEISQMSFQANHITYEYQQSFAEENLWLVRGKDAGDGDRVEGLALVYVDDVMLFGTREIVEGGLQSFRKTWETSEPTWVGDREPVRYCGMELSRTEQGDFFANQCSYLREVVRRHGMEDLCSAQMMKDSQEPEDELDRTPLQVREAQQLGGELLWLATKTRPDIAYAVSRIWSATSRAPKWAVQTAYQLIRHLNATQGLGLWYRRDANFILESVSDASFAPGGAHSHGCVITTIAGAPVAWKSCKQPFPALSTAEAELIEVIEAVVVGDSIIIACLVDEMVRDVPKFLKCDNTAAVSIASCATGAWRTRHLKVRAAHLKWRIQSGQWELKYQPGRELIADETKNGNVMAAGLSR